MSGGCWSILGNAHWPRVGDEAVVRLGRRRSRDVADLRRHRLDALARCLPAADSNRHRVVTQRYIDGRNARLPVYGRRFLLLGRVPNRSDSALLGTGLIAASRATALLEFQLLFGVLIGVAIGSYYAPMMAAATAWLEHRRSLAAALVSAGMGIGSMTVSPIAGWLLTTMDWRTAMLTIGAAAWALLIPASLLIRPAPKAAPAGVAATAAADHAGEYPLTGAQALLTPQFAA